MAGERRVSGEARHGLRHAGDIAFLDKNSSLTVDDGFANAGMAGAVHGEACHERFEHGHRCSLAIALARTVSIVLLFKSHKST